MEEGSFHLFSERKEKDYILHMDLPESRILTSFLYHRIILVCVSDTEMRNGIVVDIGKLMRYLCSGNNKSTITVSKNPPKLKCKNCGKERTSKNLWCSKECGSLIREYREFRPSILGLYESKKGLLFRKDNERFFLVGVKDPKGNFRNLTKAEKKIYTRYRIDDQDMVEKRYNDSEGSSGSEGEIYW